MKRYSEYEKVQALAVFDKNKGDIARTCNETGISQVNLGAWDKARRESNESLEQRLERMANQVLEVLPEKMEQANFQQLLRGLVMIYDMIERTQAKDGQQRPTRSEVHEKLIRLLGEIAVEHGSDQVDIGADGTGSDGLSE